LIKTCGEVENRRRWLIKSRKVNKDGGELVLRLINKTPLEISIIELKPLEGGFLLEPSGFEFEFGCHCCEKSAEKLSC